MLAPHSSGLIVAFYRIDQFKKTIINLQIDPFTCKDVSIYVLNDYAMHLIPDVRKLPWNLAIFLKSLEVVLPVT